MAHGQQGAQAPGPGAQGRGPFLAMRHEPQTNIDELIGELTKK